MPDTPRDAVSLRWQRDLNTPPTIKEPVSTAPYRHANERRFHEDIEKATGQRFLYSGDIELPRETKRKAAKPKGGPPSMRKR